MLNNASSKMDELTLYGKSEDFVVSNNFPVLLFVTQGSIAQKAPGAKSTKASTKKKVSGLLEKYMTT